LAIVAVSDQHLGIENVDKAAFNQFLDQLPGDSSVTDLVLLGDVVDMWRRDASGIFLENKDTFDKIAVLQKKMRVHYIAGNHDYHVLKLQGHSYPFKFLKDLSLEQDGVTCVFKHGYEFDEMQREHFMESLCHAMSDAKGDRDTNIWTALSRDKGDVMYAFSVLFRRSNLHRAAAQLLLDPEERLIDSLNRVEKRARASLQPGQVLVFGHTHKPFVNKENNLANTGSWVTKAAVHNTYVRLEGGKPRLFVFGGEEILERADKL
jgi:UDP-2,3-diacylglucosamine pyrophosphatase LpxH